jgi:hypothetical protein
MDWLQNIVAVGTWALVAATLWLVKGQISIAKEQRKIQLYLELRKEFDSGPLLYAREIFAGQLLDGKPHDEMNQAVLTFFEDLGMLFRRKYLDREMIWDTFGYFVRMWWSASKDYIAKERANYGGDTFFFRDFQYLVERLSEDDVKKRCKPRAELEPSASDVKVFLESEALRPRTRQGCVSTDSRTSMVKSPDILRLPNGVPLFTIITCFASKAGGG